MRSKDKRFKALKDLKNVLEHGKPMFSTIKGKWNSDFFDNNNNIVLELACGRGEYTIGLARLFSDKNFIGVDIKGDRIWVGSDIALSENLDHVGFLRTHILEIEEFFAPQEVSEIWITFPDPRPKEGDEKKRLTSPRFLEMYKQMLKPGGVVRLKTDNTALYEFTLETLNARTDISNIEHTDNLYASPLRGECFDIRTNFEEKFSAKGMDIKYLRFSFA